MRYISLFAHHAAKNRRSEYALSRILAVGRPARRRWVVSVEDSMPNGCANVVFERTLTRTAERQAIARQLSVPSNAKRTDRGNVPAPYFSPASRGLHLRIWKRKIQRLQTVWTEALSYATYFSREVG